ncbi:hypothetical protein JKP88DRAFT_350085, partial [Tribonema minus]
MRHRSRGAALITLGEARESADAELNMHAGAFDLEPKVVCTAAVTPTPAIQLQQQGRGGQQLSNSDHTQHGDGGGLRVARNGSTAAAPPLGDGDGGRGGGPAGPGRGEAEARTARPSAVMRFSELMAGHMAMKLEGSGEQHSRGLKATNTCGDCMIPAVEQALLDASSQLVICDPKCLTGTGDTTGCDYRQRYQGCRLCTTDPKQKGFICPKGSAGGCAIDYKQCGGSGWNGPLCCQPGVFCVEQNPGYFQCLPDDSKPDKGTPAPTAAATGKPVKPKPGGKTPAPTPAPSPAPT